MTDEYLDAMRDDFEKVVAHLNKELSTIRTGRATPQLLENISVSVAAYGSSMPMNQLATITAPDARTLVVNAWDKSTLTDIERAIANANLGLNPGNDGQIIRVPVPALTGERRQELVKKWVRCVRRPAFVAVLCAKTTTTSSKALRTIRRSQRTTSSVSWIRFRRPRMKTCPFSLTLLRPKRKRF